MIVRRFLEWIEKAPTLRRAEAASALARAYLHSELTESEVDDMDAALTLLLDDPAPEVRFAVADAMANSPAAPRHLILALAADRESIAELVLSRSPVLLDVELVDIAAAASDRLQCAVAARPVLSSAVSAAISEVCSAAACLTLLHNSGAAIARISLGRLADRFGDDGEIRELMLSRPNLPATIRQMLVQRLSDALGHLAAERDWMRGERIAFVTRDACDRATVAIAAESESDDLAALVEHLRVTGQLTTSLLLRATCAGNLALLEAALAALAGIPERRVARLVRGGRTAALKAIYRSAGLPDVAFQAFAAAIETSREFDMAADPAERYRHARRTVDRVLARYDAISHGEMNELTLMLRRFAADAARSASREYAEECRHAA